MKKTSKLFSRILGDQNGYSLIEFALVLALIAVMAGSVFAVYNYRVAPSTWSSSRFDLFNSVMASLNTCKNDRGNVYPAQTSATAITSVTAVAPYIGSASTDVSSWTYACTAGNASTLTLVLNTSDAPNADAMNILKNKISSAFANSTVTVGTAAITVAFTPVSCS